MAEIYTSIDQLIGRTPLLELKNVEKALGLEAKIIAKLEYLNPAGSVKDRVGKAMIDDGEASGALSPDSVIIEPTSGNTGIGLAAVAASRGYRVIIVMPDNMSLERRQILSAYGAELVLTPGAEGMGGAIRKANELANSIPHAFIAGQFVNPANPDVHYRTTGPEIFKDTDGNVDFFVSGIGTGGTITGTGRYLKEKIPAVKIIGVEPAGSAVLSGREAGPHGIQGIGAGFVPEIFDRKVCDGFVPVKEEDAYAMSRMICEKEGILVGISSGAALWAAVEVAGKPQNRGKNVVVLLPDTGDRYLSTPLFNT